MVDDYLKTIPTHTNGENKDWYNAVEQALRREIKEEVGLEVKEAHYLLDIAFIRPDGIPVIVLSYYCEYKSGEVTLDEDATEFAWIGVDKLSHYDFISGIDEEIQMVDKKLEN